jgi:hypothetical protein
MPDAVLQKAKGFLFSPVETFRDSRADEIRTILSYFGVLLLFYAAVTAVLETGLLFLEFFLSDSTVSPSRKIFMVFLIPVALFFALLIGGALLVFLFGIWTHLWVYLLGGCNGFMQTIRAILYSMTPNLLLGWIPFALPVTMLWTFILLFYGIREFQEMSESRAVAVILISVIIPIIVVVLTILIIFTLVLSGGLHHIFSSYR